MENNETDNDIEFFRKFVNSRNEELPSGKAYAIVAFIFFPVLGILISSTRAENLDFSYLPVYLIMMVVGIVCTAGSDKWFSGNRERLFMAWFASTGLGIVFFLFGFIFVYGITNILIAVFLEIHIAIAFLTFFVIINRISNRQDVKKSSNNRLNYIHVRLGGIAVTVFFGFVASPDSDMGNMVLAALFMALSTMMWTGIRRLFQLHYAVKYNIDVINTWDETPKWGIGSTKKTQCPLFGKAIDESLCVKINYENEKLMKPNKIKYLKKTLNLTPEDIREICKRCKHSFCYGEKQSSVDRG